MAFVVRTVQTRSVRIRRCACGSKEVAEWMLFEDGVEPRPICGRCARKVDPSASSQEELAEMDTLARRMEKRGRKQ